MHTTCTNVVEVSDLTVRYGKTTAVNGISFGVGSSEIFGLIGPNGAGKTSTIHCLEGLRAPTSGAVRVLGMCPRKLLKKASHRIGIHLQDVGMLAKIKVQEVMQLYASFYEHTLPIDELLRGLDLDSKRESYFKDLSGGQRQRLFGALAMLADPEILFLDELTSGLDRMGRMQILEMIETFRVRGRTVIMTTHYLDEAEAICDRIAILNQGRIIAIDEPRSLINSFVDLQSLEVTFNTPVHESVLLSIDGVRDIKFQDSRAVLFGDKLPMLRGLLSISGSNDIQISDIVTREPTLNEVFDIVVSHSNHAHTIE